MMYLHFHNALAANYVTSVSFSDTLVANEDMTSFSELKAGLLLKLKKNKKTVIPLKLITFVH